MPTSKKPRKHRRATKTYASQCYAPKTIEALKSSVVKYELIAELKFPSGNATSHDCDCLRDLINHAIADLLINDEYSDDLRETLVAGGWALRSIKARGVKTGRYVASGDELNAVREALVVAGDTLKSAYEKRAQIVINEFRAMKAITETEKSPTVQVTKRLLIQKMQRQVGQPWR